MTNAVSIHLTRQELYEKVWSMPCIKLAAEFRISDVLIGKICVKHRIPKPPPGYWAKIAHGAAVTRPPLPSINDPSLASIEITPDAGATQKIPSGEGGLKYFEENLLNNKIVVSEALDDPHPLIRATRKSLRAASPDSDGFCSPGAKGCLNVRVSRKQIPRAMLLLDALFKAAESRSMSIRVEEEKNKSITIISYENIDFRLRLWEKLGAQEKKLSKFDQLRRDRGEYISDYGRYEKIPAGEFTLETTADFCATKLWYEKGGDWLEKRLNSVIKWIYRAVPRAREGQRQHDERERQWKEDERQQRRQEAENKRFERRKTQLTTQMEGWQKAQSIRAFIIAIRKKSGDELQRKRLEAWIDWMTNYADQLDPLEEPITRLPEHYREPIIGKFRW